MPDRHATTSAPTGKKVLSFSVVDGEGDAQAIGTLVEAYVKSLVKMTSDLSDWTGTAAITGFEVGVTASGTDVTATVEMPADQPTVFMKVGD